MTETERAGLEPQSDTSHDDTLIDWFLSLTPGERLAELDSRVAFFNSVAADDEAKFPANPGAV